MRGDSERPRASTPPGCRSAFQALLPPDLLQQAQLPLPLGRKEGEEKTEDPRGCGLGQNRPAAEEWGEEGPKSEAILEGRDLLSSFPDAAVRGIHERIPPHYPPILSPPACPSLTSSSHTASPTPGRRPPTAPARSGRKRQRAQPPAASSAPRPPPAPAQSQGAGAPHPLPQGRGCCCCCC